MWPLYFLLEALPINQDEIEDVKFGQARLPLFVDNMIVLMVDARKQTANKFI